MHVGDQKEMVLEESDDSGAESSVEVQGETQQSTTCSSGSDVRLSSDITPCFLNLFGEERSVPRSYIMKSF